MTMMIFRTGFIKVPFERPRFAIIGYDVGAVVKMPMGMSGKVLVLNGI
jgi:hypothetical protein